MLFDIGSHGPEAIGFSFGEDEIIHFRFERYADTWSTDLMIEFPCHQQHIVSNGLPFHALAIHFPEQLVVGIIFQGQLWYFHLTALTVSV